MTSITITMGRNIYLNRLLWNDCGKEDIFSHKDYIWWSNEHMCMFLPNLTNYKGKNSIMFHKYCGMFLFALLADILMND